MKNLLFMILFGTILLSGLFGLVLVSSSLAQPTSKPCFKGEFEPRRALELVLGNLAPENKDVVWDLAEYLARRSDKNKTLEGGGSFKTSKLSITAPDKVLSFNRGGTLKTILLTGTKPYDSPGKSYDDQMYSCSACAPLLGAQLWSHQGTEWCLEAEDRAITRMGGAGWLAYERVQVVRVGPEKWGVLFEDDMGKGGYAPIRTTIIIPYSNGFSVAFDDITAEDNLGSGCEPNKNCYKYTGRIDFVPGTNPKYYDLRITTSGTKLDNKDRKISWNRKFTYGFSDGKYILRTDRPIGVKHVGKQ